MIERKLSIKQIQTIAIVLTVLICGVGLFDLGLSYLYREPLEKGSCSLCFELNPGYSHCENWKPINNDPALWKIKNLSFGLP
jgi:hypothetical protein